jgi:hypothetical protein
MIISDLNCLEVVSEASSVEGGLLNIGSGQGNIAPIKQNVNANAGNNGFFAVGNVALGLNIALPIQLNL